MASPGRRALAFVLSGTHAFYFDSFFLDACIIVSTDQLTFFLETQGNDRSIDAVRNDNDIRIVDLLSWIGSPI